MFRDITDLISRENTNCTWHLSSGVKDSCKPAGKTHGVIGSGSCHPYTSVAHRPDGYTPESHADYGMLFDKDGSFPHLVERDDPDFWITENVDGFTVSKNGGLAPVEAFMDRMDEIKSDSGEGKRFVGRWRKMDQKDHTKSTRKRCA